MECPQFFIFLFTRPLLLDLIGIIQILLLVMKTLYHKPILIAEIGCNHKGNISVAKKLILAAAKAGAEYAKFQIRDNKYLLGKDYFYPIQFQKIPTEKLMVSMKELEFTINQHLILQNFCKKNKIKNTQLQSGT